MVFFRQIHSQDRKHENDSSFILFFFIVTKHKLPACTALKSEDNLYPLMSGYGSGNFQKELKLSKLSEVSFERKMFWMGGGEEDATM